MLLFWIYAVSTCIYTAYMLTMGWRIKFICRISHHVALKNRPPLTWAQMDRLYWTTVLMTALLPVVNTLGALAELRRHYYRTRCGFPL